MSSPSTTTQHDEMSKNNLVHVDVGGEDLAKDGLTDSEKKFLLQKSRIGFGFQSPDQGGPYYTNRQVLEDIDISLPQIDFAYFDEAKQDVVITRSARTSAYLQAGWVDAGVAAKTPWVDVGVQASMSKSSAESQSQKLVYITARYHFAHGAIVMKTNPSNLKPHPDFKKAVMEALAITDEKKRTKEIQRVLEWWGTMFVTSVEVGGMKHSTIEKTLDGETAEESVKMKLNATLGRKCGPVEVEANAGGGTDNKQSNKQDDEFESLSFDTIGGAIEAPTLVKWRESLSEPRNWGVTRVLGVGSAISLFDEETQLKLALAIFKAPLYLFRNLEGRHRLSTEADPSKFPDVDGRLWVNWGQMGSVLTAPLDGAIPLCDMYSGKRHFCIYDWNERNDKIAKGLFWDNGVLGYVQPTQKPGTILLSRAYNAKFEDNSYATTQKDITNAATYGYTVEDYFRCYVYPA